MLWPMIKKIMNLIFLAANLFFAAGKTSIAQQKSDFWWVLGFNGPRTLTMHFHEGNPTQKVVEKRALTDITNTSFCNKEGEPLFYTSGRVIYDADLNKLRGGDSLNPLGAVEWYPIYPVPHGAIALPHSDIEKNQVSLFHQELQWNDAKNVRPFCLNYYYTLLKYDNDEVSIISKNIPFFKKIQNAGAAAACRHANGRDWWLVSVGYDTNELYVFLFDPSGIQLHHTEVTSYKFSKTTVQGLFSPDGNHWICHGVGNDLGRTSSEYQYNEIHVLNFDRSSGKFSNHRRHTFVHELTKLKYAIGAVVSPNSRFLYISLNQVLYQYDLTEQEFQLSKVLVDSIIFDPDETYPSNYFLGQLAPDGRIYYTSGNGSLFMNIVHEPNKKGSACKAQNHALPLKLYNQISIPYFPNYRLGPIDGSECDTLGIDNVPWAWWRYDQDTVEYRCFEFVDLSAYLTEESEPQWYWDLGDGTQSRDTSPVHCYQKDGVYEVCLMVKNKYGADTLCRTLHVGTSATGDAGKTILSTELFPNPATDHFVLNIHDYLPERMYLHLMNPQGQNVYTARLYQGSNFIDTRDLQPGVYSALIYERGILVKAEKLVVMRG
jgi:hypothetical protein